MLNPKQIQQLLKIIDMNQSLVIAREFGLDFLSDSDKFILESAGVEWETLYSVENDSIFTSFHMGLLSDALRDINYADKLSFKELYEYIQGGEYIPLSQAEIDVINSIKTQSLSSIRGIGGRIFKDVNGILEDTSRAAQEKFLLDETESGVRKKWTTRKIANEIAHKTGDWGRDFDRIVQYASQAAYERGKAAGVEREHGLDALVCKRVLPGACKHCIRLYLTNGLGSAPKIFTLRELINNGSNIGRKVADWLPTLDPVHPYCYDQETEVLTNQGWKFFKDLNRSELFFSVNLDTGEGEWKKAIKWVDEEYHGNMHHFSNKNFDLMTTPNHHHVIQTYSSKKLRLIETKKLPKEAQFLTHLPKWTGSELDEITFGERVFKGDDFITFLAYFLSEGSLIEYKNQTRIHISQSKKKYYKEIEKCLEELFPRFGRCIDYLQVNLSRDKDIELIKYLKSFGKSVDKFIPNEIKERSPRQIELFLKAYCQGDGSVYKGRDWDGYECKDYRLYYTSSKRIADGLSELILKIGKRPGFKIKPAQEIYDPKRDKSYMQNADIIVVSELSSKFAHKAAMKEEIVHYHGKIYDVELEGNHTLFVRRNGKIAVSGNCRCALEYLSKNKKDVTWDVQAKKFEIKPAILSSRPRPKIRAVVGGKEVWV